MCTTTTQLNASVANIETNDKEVPWKDREPTAMLANELVEDHPDRPPPISSIGQAKSVLKHLEFDGVPAWFLNRFHKEIAPIVHNIVCADLNNDFRQISVLPQIAKVLGKIQLMLNRNELKIKTSQHAFTENKSTVTVPRTGTM